MDISAPNNNDKINVAASFGSTASFSSLADSVQLNDSYAQRSLKGINSLNMSLDLSFNQLTDLESSQMISFFQKNFYYDPQEYHIYGLFTNKRIEPFDYTPFYPYKANKFYCLSYSHQVETQNVNNVTASFTCAYPSILSSVEPPAGGSDTISTKFNVAFTSRKDFAQVTQGPALEFRQGQYVYLNGGYKNYKMSSNQSPGSVSFNSGNPFTELFLEFPYYQLNASDNCLSSHNPLRHSIFIDNPNECSFYPYKPKSQDGDLGFKMFDFRPTESIQIAHSPKYKTSSVNDFYKKFNKYGYNHNLSNLSLNFNGRSDLEAKKILLFLESHLGYKKFGFHLQKQYRGNPNSAQGSSPNQKTISTFYCPEWRHTYIYKDNHNISATFIECV